MEPTFDIIDTHAHIYPLKIAAKACAHVGEFYGIRMAYAEGTVEHLLDAETAVGVRHIVVHSVATAKEQVSSINRFLAGQLLNPVLFPFGTLHPDLTAEELREEIGRMEEMGLHGVKMHPDCQGFSISGRRGRRILDALPERFPILLHAGDRRYAYSHPEQIVEVARDYPHIRFVAAHFGAYSEWEKAELYADVPNVFFDTSSSLQYIGPKRAVELIHALGPERFMFATDYPMWTIQDELKLFFQLELDDEIRRGILSGNARRILQIPD